MLDEDSHNGDGTVEAVSPQGARRTHILDAARRCFARHGFHGSSMQQICSEAHMSPGGLYRYFPSKDAIIEAIAEEERERAGSILHMMRGEAPLRQRLLQCGMAFIASSQSRECVQLMVEVSAESLRNGSLTESFKRINCEARDMALAVLREGQAKGEVRADADLEAVMFVMMAIGDGIVLRMGLEEGIAFDRIEPLLGSIIDALLTGKTA